MKIEEGNGNFVIVAFFVITKEKKKGDDNSVVVAFFVETKPK